MTAAASATSSPCPHSLSPELSLPPICNDAKQQNLPPFLSEFNGVYLMYSLFFSTNELHTRTRRGEGGGSGSVTYRSALSLSKLFGDAWSALINSGRRDVGLSQVGEGGRRRGGGVQGGHRDQFTFRAYQGLTPASASIPVGSSVLIDWQERCILLLV